MQGRSCAGKLTRCSGRACCTRDKRHYARRGARKTNVSGAFSGAALEERAAPATSAWCAAGSGSPAGPGSASRGTARGSVLASASPSSWGSAGASLPSHASAPASRTCAAQPAQKQQPAVPILCCQQPVGKHPLSRARATPSRAWGRPAPLGPACLRTGLMHLVA